MIFSISYEELCSHPWIILSEEMAILTILKEKGAPVEGRLWKKIKDGYSVKCIEDPLTKERIFEFKRENDK